MTKEQFDKKYLTELTPTEIALINFNIYFHKDHIKYYMDYNLGEYAKCYDYLIENRHLLTLEHTSPKRYNQAQVYIKHAKELLNKKTTKLND